MGAGRSGTTLLDIILGNQTGILSVGELNRYFKRRGIPHSARDEQALSFWQSVAADIEIAVDKISSVGDKIEYHTGIFKSLIISDEQISKYECFNSQLFAAIEKNAAPVHAIVDSSKYPLRADRLAQVFGNSLSIVYIQRHPNEVVASFGKTDVEQPSKRAILAHLYLLVVHLLAKFVLFKNRKTVPYTVVSYDTLVSSPTEVVESISACADVDLEEVLQKLKHNELFEVGYLFDGNRLRLQGQTSLRLRTNYIKRPKSVLNSIFLPIHRFFWYKF